MFLRWVVPDDDALKTPPGATQAQALDHIGRHVTQTAQNSQATLDRVDELRREIEARLGRVTAEVSTAREASARNEGKLDAMINILDAERKSRQQYEAAAAAALAASTEVVRTRALSEIEAAASDREAERTERVERKRLRREIALKILAGIAALWTAIATYLLAQ